MKYIDGEIIKKLREKKNFTQKNLAQMLNVSDKTISKWETNRGFPDISLIEPLSKALGISIIELFNGELITNMNKSFNMKKSAIYVCPICGNVIVSSGEGVFSCCGINLIKEEAREDDDNIIRMECIENEYYVSINHEMTKTHYISFILYLTDNRYDLVKLYPEQECSAYFPRYGRGTIYAWCNHDGLIKKKI